MTEISIRFRGVVAMVPMEDRIRFLLPDGMQPRASRVRPEFIIPRHYPYLAVVSDSVLARTTPPNMIVEITDHAAEVSDGDEASAELALRRDLIGRMLARDVRRRLAQRVVSDEDNDSADEEEDFVPSDVYFLLDHKVVFPEPDQVGVEVKDEYLIADMKSINVDASTLSDEDFTKSRTAACAYIDVFGGTLTPVVLQTYHEIRFIYGDAIADGRKEGPVPKWLQETAHDVRIDFTTSDPDPILQLVTRDKSQDPIDIALNPSVKIEIVIGNESMDDIIGKHDYHHCGEPAYEFELIYNVCQTQTFPKFPVPVCVTPHEFYADRQPPDSPCSNIVKVGPPS